MTQKDIIGNKYWKLTVVSVVPKEDRVGGKDAKARKQYHCVCDCGNKVITTRTNLISGRTKSCGCIHREAILATVATHGLTCREAGGKQPRLFMVWRNMKQRCELPTIPAYKYYGARGIKVCEEWRNSYAAFYEWAMAAGYDKNAPYGECTIERIDVDGDYEPSNCCWVTLKEQARNKQCHKRKRESEQIICG